jgi:SSS family solute:Na+ symporter
MGFMLLIGFRAMRRIKKLDDFYVAGKSGTSLSITGSLLATILGSSAILGTINLGESQGWASSWLLICASLGMFALVPLAKYVRRFGKYTLPQLLGDFYGPGARKLSSAIIPIAWIGIVAAQIIGAAKILTSFAGIEYTWTVLIAGGVFILYTVAGGQKSIIKTDYFQSLFIVGGIAVLTFFIFNSLEIPVGELSEKKFPFNESFGTWDLVVLLLTYSTTFVVGPDIYSRLFCAKDEKTASRSVLLTAIILLAAAFMLSFIGVYSASTYPEVDSTTSLSFLNTISLYFPEWLTGLMIAALLSAVMSSADTTLLTAAIILSDPIRKKSKGYRLGKTRLLIALLGTASVITALQVTSIIGSLLLALTFFSGAFIVPTASGLLGKRTGEKQAVAAMIVGGVTALAGKLVLMYTDTGRLGYYMIFAGFILNALILFYPTKKKEI